MIWSDRNRLLHYKALESSYSMNATAMLSYAEIHMQMPKLNQATDKKDIERRCSMILYRMVTSCFLSDPKNSITDHKREILLNLAYKSGTGQSDYICSTMQLILEYKRPKTKIPRITL